MKAGTQNGKMKKKHLHLYRLHPIGQSFNGTDITEYHTDSQLQFADVKLMAILIYKLSCQAHLCGNSHRVKGEIIMKYVCDTSVFRDIKCQIRTSLNQKSQSQMDKMYQNKQLFRSLSAENPSND